MSWLAQHSWSTRLYGIELSSVYTTLLQRTGLDLDSYPPTGECVQPADWEQSTSPVSFSLAGAHKCWQFEFLPCISSPHSPKHLLRGPHSLGFQISPLLLCLICLSTYSEFYPLFPITCWILHPGCLTSSLHSTGIQQKSCLLALCLLPSVKGRQIQGV